MARYEHLPIYKKTVELVVFVEGAVSSFPRYHRYAIGADLRNLARRLAALVMQVNSRDDKIGALTDLRDQCEEFKLMVLIAKEVKAFKSFSEFQRAAVLAAEIGRQSQGWLNSQAKGQRPESPLA